MIFHISHGAMRSDDPSDVDWFLVKPLDGETHPSVAPGHVITHADAVNSLIRARRTVFELDTETMTAMRISEREATNGRSHRG